MPSHWHNENTSRIARRPFSFAERECLFFWVVIHGFRKFCYSAVDQYLSIILFDVWAYLKIK